MRTDSHEERIGVFLDYENLAIGARESLGLIKFKCFSMLIESLNFYVISSDDIFIVIRH